MKSIIYFVLIFFTYSLNAQAIDELLIKAQIFENEKKYEEAMQIYKQIALEQKKVNKIYIDEDKKKIKTTVSNTINKIEDKKTKLTIEQILASSFDIYPYKENYFLPISYDMKERDGKEQAEAKFQISVKKPIIHDLFNLDETINFGYTQTSWWQIYKESSPFRETNYKPEIFIDIPYGKKDKTALKWLKFGFIHESNGQSGDKSRSWNRIYFTSSFQAQNLFIFPTVWYRISESKEEDDNPDILKYLGYGNLTFIYPYKSNTFKLLLRNNLRFNNDNKGYAQFDWTFPFFNFKNAFGYFQLSSGYGDSLIDYDKEINRISFGISLSR